MKPVNDPTKDYLFNKIADQRDIEKFEVKAKYYRDSWVNGNKTHVKEELAELLTISPLVCCSIIVEMPSKIAKEVIESVIFRDKFIWFSIARNRKK